MINQIGRIIYNKFLKNRLLSRWFIFFIDISNIICATVISYFLTLKIYNKITIVYHPRFVEYLGVAIFFNLLFFWVFKTYRGIVRYSTVYEFQRILIATLFADSLLFLTLHKVMGLSGGVSLAYCTTLFLASLVGLYSFRIIVVCSYQILIQRYEYKLAIPVYVWGLDEATIAAAQLLRTSSHKFKIIGFLTVESDSQLKKVIDLPVFVLKKPDDLNKYKIKDVLFTKESDLKDHVAYVEKLFSSNTHIYITQETNIDNMSQLTDAVNRIRPIQIEDLLGRSEINISLEIIGENVKDKTILVTGAAGSIGSEIVRQLANLEPRYIVCLDQAETPLYDLDIELQKKYPNLNYTAIVGDVRNRSKLAQVFTEYRPNIVYHAAAYKHVPLMEKHPCEAVLTNVHGTKLVVDLAIENAVEMFIMISTDKAVNPTNIMGATKRLAEIYVQSCANDLYKNKFRTKFVTTRFGNVLGSNGSVIPLFRKQIESGGPITVTHREITRYFMTIPEACRLVLEASVIGKSGYIYVFDMGQPVKIYDLAEKMIKLVGLIPEKDIRIEFSGLRPGEKLYEELLNDSEITEQTTHEKIMKAKVREYHFQDILPQIESIISIAQKEDKYQLVVTMKKIVPEFLSNNSEFESMDVDVLSVNNN
ncbi:polysaccharide biosynthesis protein [Dysgonomonas sp. HDW5B]|uniref:UDP-N-acetylglucosamine 4,6-dehydratase family protein n=1 Tax=Dysgonomonas sp. HDW5B TaxID=2714927 RepID=UPI00140BC57B|nr:nucleoside-diphosphate sugar epimerase/dehydratase [Dysgonomonas sp. HDW5B]QIK52856.1 polysaccharide biosynthesis protein [Dysgonomonas sp. HDW5B]